MRYFKPAEFECKCGRVACPARREGMDRDLLRMLDAARGIADRPFYINSGLRCPEHNIAVGGSVNSSHLAGHAVDIRCTDSTALWQMLNALRDVGFTRFGIGDTYIHVDNDPNKPSGVIWFYG